MSVGGLVPLPSDALVTPVTFRVQRRKLRGILAEFDAAEDGTRELSGEWVVGKKTWQRLQTEWRKTRTERLTVPDQLPKSHKEHVVLYVHGGQFMLPAPFQFADSFVLQVPTISPALQLNDL